MPRLYKRWIDPKKPTDPPSYVVEMDPILHPYAVTIRVEAPDPFEAAKDVEAQTGAMIFGVVDNINEKVFVDRAVLERIRAALLASYNMALAVDTGNPFAHNRDDAAAFDAAWSAIGDDALKLLNISRDELDDLPEQG